MAHIEIPCQVGAHSGTPMSGKGVTHAHSHRSGGRRLARRHRRSTHAATVTITRDKWGVPHIFIPPSFGSKTAQLKALGFAQGYATAQDRMVQLEFFRRAGKGRLSEIGFLGPSYLPGDIVVRRDGFTEAEFQQQFKTLPAKGRISLQAFADGVNRFLSEVGADPSLAPAEFGLLGLAPEPWSVTDSLAIAMLQIRRFGQNGGNELDNARLLLDLLDHFPLADAKGIFGDLLWLEDPTAPTTISPAEQHVTPHPISALNPVQVALVTAHQAAIRGTIMSMAEKRTMVASLMHEIGWPYAFPATASNAMVVSGSLTASGSPILLGGPQTGMTLPSFFYQVGVHGAGYDASGVTVPGGTGIVIGRTANAAWTITSGITDNTDTFIEELNPANPKQYAFRGSYKDMSCRMETFNPAGQPSQTIEFCRTVHGPVIASYPSENIAFSQQLYFFGREGQSAVQLLSLGFATNFKRFQRTINKVEASLNCMYGDNAENIAYFHRGVLPHRPATVDPRLPLPGTGEAETLTLTKGRRMPTAINPALGYIAQWNNKPILGWPADDQRELWGGVDRVQVLLDQLAAAKAANHPITAGDVSGYMKTAATTDFLAPRIFPYLRNAVDALPPATPDLPQLEAATDLIGAWLSSAGGALLADGSGNIPFPGVTIYRAWRTQVQRDTFDDELGTAHNRLPDYVVTRTGGDNEDSSGDLISIDALFRRVLDGPAAAFPTSRDYFRDVATNTNPGRDATLVGSLRTVIAALTAKYGTANPTQWLTAKITVEFDETSASSFFYGPTIIEREDRGTMNEVIELTPTLASQIVVPPGNSGYIQPSLFPEPPHLRDQVALYESFQYHSLPFTQAELEGPTTSQTITLP
jgi:penicillin G amidase